MNRRTAIVAGVVILLGAGLVGVLFFPSEEQKIKTRLDRLAKAVSFTEGSTNPILRGARVRSELEDLLDPEVRLSIPEVPGMGAGRAAVEERALAAPMFVRSLSVELRGVDVKIDDAKENAKVAATAWVTAVERAGRQRGGERATNFLLSKRNGEWKVTSITVWTPAEVTP